MVAPGRYVDDDRLDVVAFVPPDVRSVLDVGCFSGGFGQALKQRRRPFEVDVWGVEPDPAAATVAAERLDRVLVGTFPESLPDRTFDCVVFNDVLEHLVDPGAALAAARALLSPNGVVVASIPNVRHFSVVVPLVLYGRWTYQDLGVLDRTHVRFFTRSSMLELFHDAELEVDTIAPLRISRVGTLARILGLFGPLAIQFLAKCYVMVASQSSRAAPISTHP